MTIPIIMASDENYSMPMCVAINSILASKNDSTNYSFHLMIPEDFKEETKAKYTKLTEQYAGTEISYHVMGDLLASSPITIAHISYVTYYRLLIADTLPHLEKCLYLDGDIIVCADLAELFLCDLKNNYIGGVKAPSFYTMPNSEEYCFKTGLKSIDQYINAGVLLMNLTAIRNDGLTTQFLDLIPNRLMNQDQDIINVVCYDRITFLPFKFNFMPERSLIPNIDKVFTQDEVDYAKEFPSIIHYVKKEKPWNSLTGYYFFHWWKSALSSPYSEEVWSLAVNFRNASSNDGVQVRKLKRELSQIRKSKSYRFGNAVFWLPHKAKRGIQCLKVHGLRYTLKHGFNKVSTVINKQNQENLSNSSLTLANNVFSTDKTPIVRLYKNCYREKIISTNKYPEELGWHYKANNGGILDLAIPKTYSEKIQWIKLYDKSIRNTHMVDKYLVRDWASKLIGEKFLVPILGQWDNFDEIYFSGLPSQFVLKATHGQGWSLVVKDKSKFDIKSAKTVFDYWLGLDYAFCNDLDLQYKGIQPKIIAEKYIEIVQLKNDYPFKYKAFCFNGLLKYIQVSIQTSEGTKFALYNREWKLQPPIQDFPQYEGNINKPTFLSKMINFSDKLSNCFFHMQIKYHALTTEEFLFSNITFSTGYEYREYEKEFSGLMQLPFESPDYKINHPKISIIVPVYNTEKYVKKCLESISNQTLKNLEIIVVNDGSSDNSGRICDAVAATDSRIKVIHKKNEGVSVARNTGIDIATGSYIGFVDGDDWIEPQMYEYLLANAENNSAEISICGYFRDDILTGLSSPFGAEDFLYVLNRDEALAELVEDNKIKNYTVNRIYKTELFNNVRFPDGEKHWQDVPIMYKVFEKSNNVAFHNKHLYHYTIRPDSTTGRGELMNCITSCKLFQERYHDLGSRYPELKDAMLKKFSSMVMAKLFRGIVQNPIDEVETLEEMISEVYLSFINSNYDKIYAFTPKRMKNEFACFVLKGAVGFKKVKELDLV